MRELQHEPAILPGLLQDIGRRMEHDREGHEDGQVDGRGEEAADRREEGQRRARVLKSIQGYMGRKTRHGKRHYAD